MEFAYSNNILDSILIVFKYYYIITLSCYFDF